MERKVYAVFIILGSSLILLFLTHLNLTSPFYAFSSLFSNPRAFLYQIAHAESEPDELKRLKEENRSLQEQLQKVKNIQQDNTALRSQFQDTTFPPQTLLPAKIVGFKGSIENPTSFVLDQGLKSGVKKDQAVVVGKQLVGKIVAVSDYFSEVMLVVNKDFTTLAVSGDHNSPGIVTGFDEFIVFDHVVITDTISRGENVLTKGEQDRQGVGIPADLIIGKITKVNKSETKPLQSATIKSLLNFNTLSTVFVVNP